MQPQDRDKLLSDAFSFLSQQTMGVISTISQDNTPESASVNYMVDSGWEIYVITNKDSRKVQNIKQNNHVSFVVGAPQIPHTAQIQADAQILEPENSEYDTLLTKLKESKVLDRNPIYSMFSGNYVILKLKITWLRWLFFEDTTGKEVYTVLIP